MDATYDRELIAEMLAAAAHGGIHLFAMDAVMGQIAALRAADNRDAAGVDADEDAYVIEHMGKLLAEIAVIVNGPEPALTRWSYHDLPDKVRALKTAPAAAPAGEATIAPAEAKGDGLWCLHVLGPDEVHAAPSKAHAEQAVAIFNATFPRGEGEVRVEAVVAPWPHSEKSHAESVAEFIPNWLLPRWQVEALTKLTPQPAGGKAVAWRHPDEVPEVVPGGNAYFWVAVRRKHDGRVYSFPAQYLNAMLLCNEWSDDTERSGNRYHHGPTCEDEGSFPATGWHNAKEHGEYDCVYQPLLGDADELVAWREVADYPATTPPAAQVQQEAEKYEGDTLVKLSRLLAHMCDTSTFQPPNDYNLGFAAGCEMARRTTHPAAGDKVRELVAKWRREADRLRAINAEMDPDGKTFRYAECLREENAAQAHQY